ncbi:transcriptional regulator [Vibrio sp. UCD-FRSSP16_10]|uniref:MarR family winged helix-turn-helix transcriptional regulator n=1 Tax=unclassified Vibrio TaxID=2614977 RepID=UPI0007FEB721|nr:MULTISPECIES: MarR family transcriptional regulator [unclassified Vibrio]OBT12069.1 transcriptional regulator [Vibrio sp. UCD-FRSSP16_30]OBT20400.1 transcriptional regulator [Vibrio sp. UCD-FRSSP16_10]
MQPHHSIVDTVEKSKNNWPEAFTTLSPSILRIHRLHDYLRNNMEQLVKQYDLQAADFGVLETLRKEPQPYCLSPTDLYQGMLFSSGGLTKVLNRLTDAQLIERMDNPLDKRSKLVVLSPQGKELIEMVIQDLHQIEQKSMARLSDLEKQQLEQLLSKLLGEWE